MSLPGLQLNSAPVQVEVQKSSIFHELEPNTEWRFEVAFGITTEVKVCGTRGVCMPRLFIKGSYR